MDLPEDHRNGMANYKYGHFMGGIGVALDRNDFSIRAHVDVVAWWTNQKVLGGVNLFEKFTWKQIHGFDGFRTRSIAIV